MLSGWVTGIIWVRPFQDRQMLLGLCLHTLSSPLPLSLPSASYRYARVPSPAQTSYGFRPVCVPLLAWTLAEVLSTELALIRRMRIACEITHQNCAALPWSLTAHSNRWTRRRLAVCFAQSTVQNLELGGRTLGISKRRLLPLPSNE